MFSKASASILALIAFVCLASCGSDSKESRPLVILAAASLQEALEAEADVWAWQGHPRPTMSFAASSALARQVTSGAPADLFLSADEEWMDTLEKAGALKSGTRRDLLTNSIVLIAPQESAAAVDLARPESLGSGPLAMADPAAVPAGKYGKAALQRLGLWQAVAARIVPAENVRAAQALVESGEAPLGIVYATDAAASEKVRILARFPEDSHPPIRYPVAILAASDNPEAEAFEQFLASKKGQAIFARFGFGIAK
jgi:molybdate transport system substrate-binding protein